MTADLPWYLNPVTRKADRMPKDPTDVLLKAGWELVPPEVVRAVRELHRAARVSVVDDVARVEFERVAPESWQDATELPPDLRKGNDKRPTR